MANIDTIDSGNTEISIVCPAADMLQINGSSTTTHSGNLFQEAGLLAPEEAVRPSVRTGGHSPPALHNNGSQYHILL